MRSGTCERVSGETIVSVTAGLDGAGRREISTGIPMYDHLLAQFAFHSGCDLEISARSLDAIAHHVIEDVALVLGDALSRALGERRGIARYGWCLLPMDDALARVAVDLGGRPYSRTELGVSAPYVEELEVAMIPHFFSSISWRAGMTVHVDLLAGSDPHHKIEACFKGFGRACAAAWAPVAAQSATIPSTKGVI